MNETFHTHKMNTLPASFTRFMKISSAVLPWLIGITLCLLILGFILIIYSPDDYQQGITVKIMYIHAPFAWLSTCCYIIISAAALGSLIWKYHLADVTLKCGAPIGAIFTALTLVTGALWGRPTWGTWWVWDARLTSVLILLFIYLAIVMLARAFNNQAKAARATAILTLVGLVNIPIIKFSVNWWNTLHQSASLLRAGGPTIERAMLWPLITMLLCFSFMFISLYLMAMRNEINSRYIQILQIKKARRAQH
ncbi:heme transporter HemC [Bartonella henselae]|uniref:Heme exporter protein C n=1 Tax=Bartonella henselae TaxID=38323 RepID=X5M5K8_BARHN|nr:heme ABC transporter permease [Bartonella henselae]MDM9996443.1 heme ABC transporter permease [Bartonella henselae]OLL47593.1 heme transporter HemC [Bartonella henselae]OLL50167.1 heme transporter HemC [Bartonella henselae]OLL50638.1 heme transporter HemC [Bartonella henselae]OLL56375.1 heme transporter HemC [Bartonella henselae]